MAQEPSELENAHKEIERLKRENEELRGQISRQPDIQSPLKVMSPGVQYLPLSIPSGFEVTEKSPDTDKIRLFRSLFRGREDVYATLWISERTGKKGYSPACENPWAARTGKPIQYFPLTDEVVRAHLEGEKTIGIYPLLKDNSCWFLACDFDKSSWMLDAMAFLECAQRHGIPAYLERSRSGNGGHIWFFFAAPIAATQARQLGTRLLSEAMAVRGDMDLASYDRFFPSQDFVPKGGFGNLIAVPLQKAARDSGNMSFLDVSVPGFRPWADQWHFLSLVNRISPDQFEDFLGRIPPVELGPDSIQKGRPGTPPAPAVIRGRLKASLSIERSGIPPWLLSRLKHLASLHNPMFYERQRLRFSTWNIPRFIRCYAEDFAFLHLPRGIQVQAEQIIKDGGSKLAIKDDRPSFPPLSLAFNGALHAIQERALSDILSKDIGVFVAPPGAGKTVIGCCAIARRNVPTLVLSHRKPILDQWRKHLISFLGLKTRHIGQVGGGRDRQSHIVDLGMLQSLKRIPDQREFFSGYGFIIVDECHHIPAVTFEACLKEAPVRYILGLTATPYRRDGLQALITMQCGPICHTIKSTLEGLSPELVIRTTEFRHSGGNETAIQDIFSALVKDNERDAIIEGDIRKALSENRRCLILSHWKEQCRRLASCLETNGVKSIILDGSLGKQERDSLIKAIKEHPDNQGLAVLATGQYLGEGFDWPQVDTLFLAFPISFKGKLVQYIGRIMRPHEGKPRPRIFDYVDESVPVLRAMSMKRMKAYKSLGISPGSIQSNLFHENR